MKVDFIVNEYILAWYMLFQASVSPTIYELKKRLWNTYRCEYSETEKDIDALIEDPKDFIPNNDIIYNIIFESDEFAHQLKSVEKNRRELLSVWDKYKKETNHLYKDIIRKDIGNYKFFIVCKELNLIDVSYKNTVILGVELEEDKTRFLIKTNKKIIDTLIKHYEEREQEEFRNATLSLVIDEYSSLLHKKSMYRSGTELKKWLYPYFLMYLGVNKNELQTRMRQDNMYFDATHYAYEGELQKMCLEEFIDFCIRNKRYIVRKQEIEIL